MKRITVVTLALVFVIGVFAAPNADAGWFNKKKSDRTEKPDWMKKPKRYDGPVMSFHSGVLQQDGWTGWKLGETKIQFADECLITTDGVAGGVLDAGSNAIIMGPKFGDTILAWSVRVQKPDFMTGRAPNSEVQLKYSESNSNCGEVITAPR